MQHIFGPSTIAAQQPPPALGLALDCIYNLSKPSTATRIGFVLLVPLTTAGGLLLAALLGGLFGKVIAAKPPEKKIQATPPENANEEDGEEEEGNAEEESAQGKADPKDTPPKAVVVFCNLMLTYVVLVYTLLPVIFGAAMIGLSCFRSPFMHTLL